MECLSISPINPNPTFPISPLFNKHLPSSSSSMASFSSSLSPPSPFSFRPQSLHRRNRPLPSPLPPLKGLCFSPNTRNLSFLSFAASQSHDDSKPSEAEIEREKDDLKQAGEASQVAWEQALASFKEQALKLQSVSQEAYEEYSKKAVVVLKETAEKLKIQADQARQDLSVIAKELSEEGRQYLTVAAENSPEPVKDVVETFAAADNLDDISKVYDFYIGIPYGTILSVGGFLNFMITGSISALRFGVILGGVLLALSVSSLRSWRRGEATDMTLKGQAAISGILFLRELRLLLQGLKFVGLVKTVVSGAVAAFFIYRILYGDSHKRTNLDGEVQS